MTQKYTPNFIVCKIFVHHYNSKRSLCDTAYDSVRKINEKEYMNKVITNGMISKVDFE